jgi:peptidoglycan/LPS O-acetylase OafA/YrhL
VAAVGVLSEAPARPPAAHRARTTLADAFDPRRNAIGFLRLAAAGLVVVSHSFPLGGFGTEPLAALTGQETLGGVAVATFFVLSGFLIARSALNGRGMGTFLRRRALRILPGYWVAVVVTAFAFGSVFWWHDHGTLAGFLGGGHGPLQYIERNWLVEIRQWDLGSLRNNPYPAAVNGSLWTLADELRCYLVLALLVAAGVVERRRAPVLLVLVLLWWVVGLAGGLPIDTSIWFPIYRSELAHHFLAFTLGAAAYVYSDRIPVNRGTVVLAATLLIGVMATRTYGTFGIFPFAYLILVLGAALPFTKLNTTTDLSYGLYIYAFPVQQMLASFGLNRAGLLPYLTLTVVVTTGLAFLSWRLVEKPAMRLR